MAGCFPHPDDETSGLGGTLANASADAMRPWFGKGGFYRVFSMVNSGRAVETDLFEGFRD